MKLSECEIGDVLTSEFRTVRFLGVDGKYGICETITVAHPYEKVGHISNEYVMHYDGWELVSRKSNDEKYYEIESLKMQLKNIQKRIDKLEEETYFEIGSIYEINYHGNIIKGCLVEILNESYRFITNSTAVYNIEKNSNSKFKKFPDESVKNFFRKDSK